MRLAHIRLAGFKSFVDPTHIALRGQIVGIVGPNGCGKSNVIDALRWVLGESRASALRGESMQDVIFNGAGTRKPVSRASVELVFDNSLGKAAGQWSSYAEIAIRRVLTRDGESSYYINNQPVRRKDVTDIFLGTGLGARAYAIIEQGMISRIIEAKPEELRIFLEEAAGVSKYRDRRRETELRLSDTRDNLLRVSDILQELDKQLEHLAAQAEVARQYRELEARRDTTQRLLWLVNQQEAEARRTRLAQQAAQQRNELEAETARLREAEAQLETARAEHFSLADALHARQGELYAVNAEVARLEQQIAFIHAQRDRLVQQLAQGERQISQQQSQRDGLQSLLLHWQQQQQEAAARVARCESHAENEAQHLPSAEREAAAARERLSGAERAQLLAQQQLQLAEAQRGHVQANLQQLESRRARLLLEQDNLPRPDLDALQQAERQLAELEREASAQAERLAELQQQQPMADRLRQERRQTVQEQERQLAQCEARLHALQRIQKQLDQAQHLTDWLARHALESAPRLWSSIRIEAGWEEALEAVLHERLNALALGELEQSLRWAELPPARLAVYTAQGQARQAVAELAGCPPLSRYVSCQDGQAEAALADWLYGVYVTDSLETALARREALPPGTWLVTPQGHLVGVHSVQFHAPDSQVHGLLARQREIEQLQQQGVALRAALGAAQAAALEAEEQYRAGEAQLAALRSVMTQLQQRQHGLQLQILKLTQANERSRERAAQIAQELSELGERSTMEQKKAAEIAAQIAALRETLSASQSAVEQAAEQLTVQESRLREQRERVQRAQHALQEARFFAQTCTGKIADLTQSIAHNTASLTELQDAQEQARREMEGLADGDLQQQLQAALARRRQHEAALAEARNLLEQATLRLQQRDQARLESEQRLHPLREKLNELLLREQEARLQAEQWAEHLQGVEVAALLPLAEGARADGLQNALNRINDDIVALGAVNLAALEELQTAQERRAYLAAQAQDLREAMETLEEAIRRIDKESRELLLNTYGEVNRHLAELFPVLFGGGEARLVLTGDEILDSGVQIMAHPPGKRNSSIHLLSGGEKALAALALVFSLFQLNPAPFCLLDEVDAPLDDANTERLCNLVRKMAVHTQFVYISHNKITMEMAQQLVGVTMQERGVSKVVSVDIEEAIRLSEQAA